MEEYKSGYISVNAQNKLNDCLITFDFAKCSDIMTYLDMMWVSLNNQVPEPDDIKYQANKMLISVYKGFWENNKTEPYYCDTGGLSASYCYYDDIDDEEEKHHFELKFIPVESL